jgi:hypothetical protein
MDHQIFTDKAQLTEDRLKVLLTAIDLRYSHQFTTITQAQFITQMTNHQLTYSHQQCRPTLLKVLTIVILISLCMQPMLNQIIALATAQICQQTHLLHQIIALKLP